MVFPIALRAENGNGAVSEGGVDPGQIRRIGLSEQVGLSVEDPEGVPGVPGEEERQEDRGDEARGRGDGEEGFGGVDGGVDSERSEGEAEGERGADELALPVGLGERCGLGG